MKKIYFVFLFFILVSASAKVKATCSSTYPAQYFDANGVMQKLTTSNTARISYGNYIYPERGANLGLNNINDYYSDPNGIVWGCNDNGLYKSTDRGGSFVAADLISRQGSLNPRMIFRASNGYLYWNQWGDGRLRRSVDNGVTWTTILTFASSGDNVGIDGFDENKLNGYLFFGVYTSGEYQQDEIYRSKDRGETWEKVYDGPDRHVHKLACDPYNPGHIYATTGDKPTSCSVLASYDNGDTWADIYSAVQLWGISFLPTMRLFGDDDTGGYIYKTTDDVNFSYAWTPDGSYYGSDATIDENGVVYFTMIAANNGYYPKIIYTADGTTWKTLINCWTTTAWNGFQQISNIDKFGSFFVFYSGNSYGYRINTKSGWKLFTENLNEPASTNYCINSCFYLDTNSDGIANNWTVLKSSSLTPTYSLVDVTSIFNVNTVVNAQRVQQSGQTSTTAQIILRDSTSHTGFSSGDSVTISAYIKGSLVGCYITLGVYEYDSEIAYLRISSASEIVGVSQYGYNRFSRTVTLGESTAGIKACYYIYNIDTGDSCDVQLTALNCEKLSNATSFIPTTTAEKSRNVEIKTSDISSNI